MHMQYEKQNGIPIGKRKQLTAFRSISFLKSSAGISSIEGALGASQMEKSNNL